MEIFWLIHLLFGNQGPGTSNPPLEQRLFEDVTQAVGLDFVHFNGMTGKYYLPEITGQGGALLDYDGDGDLDVYLVQGHVLEPGKKLSDAWYPYRGKGEPRDRLLRNELTLNSDGSVKIHFTDVTVASGINARGYGMGVTSGDINNDGYPDLYITNLGANQLFINNGDGSFTDQTGSSGTDDPRWSTSASFFDYDRDGWLDLFLTNYVVFHAPTNPKCYTPGSMLDFCGPDAYPPSPDRLFHNKGGGVFEIATKKMRTQNAFGAGLGVVTADFNGDGWMDIYVANDGDANQLWINGKNGTFSDEGLLSGVALNRAGSAEASMGVAAGDFDEDGDEDLFMTHLMDETNTLYLNGGGGFFDDRTVEFGLAVPSRRFTAFGTFWIDVNNDGWLDLITLNGAVSNQKGMGDPNDRYPFREPNQLFLNRAGKKFEEIHDSAISDHLNVSRGAACGDIDNDGDSDILILNNNGPARLLLNRSRQNWIGFRFLDRALKRDMLGTRVKVIAGDRTWQRRVKTDGSYCSAHDPRLILGLDKRDSVTGVEVTWPDGTRERWSNPPVNRYTTLYKGSGEKK